MGGIRLRAKRPIAYDVSARPGRSVSATALRFVTLPAGTLRVKGQSYCAALRGLPFEPCFNLDRSSERSFRGAVAGFNFAYCDFNRGNTRQAALRPNWRSRLSMQNPAAPLRLHTTPSPATTETAEITD